MLYSLPANTAFIRYFRVVLSIQAQAKDLLLTRCQQLTDHVPQQCLALVFFSYRIILFLVWNELRGSQFLTHDVRQLCPQPHPGNCRKRKAPKLLFPQISRCDLREMYRKASIMLCSKPIAKHELLQELHVLLNECLLLGCQGQHIFHGADRHPYADEGNAPDTFMI